MQTPLLSYETKYSSYDISYYLVAPFDLSTSRVEEISFTKIIFMYNMWLRFAGQEGVTASTSIL